MRRLIPVVLFPALALVPLPAAAAPAAPAPAAPAPAPAGPAPSPAPLPPPPGDLAGEVARTAQELAIGTRRLQDDEARLAELTQRAEQVRAQAQEAGQRAERTRTTLHATVGAAYRSPRPGAFAQALAAPGALADALQAAATLEQVQGRQDEQLRAADDDRRRAEDLAGEAERLAADAAEQRRVVAEEVAALQATAEQARLRFEAAAAAQEADRQARELAAARADRGRAPEVPAPPAGVVTGACGGGSLAGSANGMLPTSALCPLDGTDGLLLRADAAAAFNRMAAAGGMPCAGNAYRSYSQQVSLYAQKPDLAAVPGTSNHGWGVAVDFACGAESFGTPAYAWLKANGPLYGWTHPSWAEPGGSRPEPWHWEYTG